MMRVELTNVMGDDLSVVDAARVSFAKQSSFEFDEEGFSSLSSADTKLINYLAKHKHFSPFNHAFLSFRVNAPVFVARQLVKHEYLVWNEVSRRYVDSDPEFYTPVLRKVAANVKQGSSEEKWVDVAESDVEGRMAYLYNDAYNLYKDMIEAGVCAEQARMVLPQSMMTEWIWSGSLKAFAKMCKLRLDPHTQEETREVAHMINDVVEGFFPVSWPALLKADVE